MGLAGRSSTYMGWVWLVAFKVILEAFGALVIFAKIQFSKYIFFKDSITANLFGFFLAGGRKKDFKKSKEIKVEHCGKWENKKNANIMEMANRRVKWSGICRRTM